MCIDWSNFISTLAGAFAGAWGAYYFNLRQAGKQEKETEKAKILKLFYDMSILAKFFVYYHENIVAEINNLTESEVKSVVPITIKNTNFDINEYGFITKISPKLYEILTYVHQDINYIYEQQNAIEEYLKKKLNVHVYTDYLNKLENTEVAVVKLLAKLFVSLININNFAVRHYDCKNLIKDEIVNAYIRTKKIIDETIEDYLEILNDRLLERNYDAETIKTIKTDLEYINEIIDTWVVDFGLKKKQRVILETEIEEQVKNKWEAPENDL